MMPSHVEIVLKQLFEANAMDSSSAIRNYGVFILAATMR